MSKLVGRSPNAPYCREDKFLDWWDNLPTHSTAGETNFWAGGTICQQTLLQGRRIFGLVGQSPNTPFCRGEEFLGLVGQSPNAPYCRGDKFLGWWDNNPMHTTAGETNFWAGGPISQNTLLQGRRTNGLVGRYPNAPYCRGDKFLGWWDNLSMRTTAGERISGLVGQSANAPYCRGDKFIGWAGGIHAPYCRGDKFMGW